MLALLERDFERISPFVNNDTLRDSRWLITGATGMIGSYLLGFLAWLNEEKAGGTMKISAVHRRELTSEDPNVGYLLGKDFIRFKKADLSEGFDLDPDEEYDFVFHGATSAAPREYLRDPVGTININVKTTQKLLDHFRGKKRLKSFLYVSSGEIYGNPDPKDVPTPEDYHGLTDHLGPRSCYVESKRFGETLCCNYRTQYGVPIQIVRPIQVFGPGFQETDSRAWVDFIVKSYKGEDVEILGDGMARRAYCYSSDGVVQLFAVIQKGEIGGVYNIGQESHISIKELAEIIARTGDRRVRVVIKDSLPDYLKGSPQISCPSIAKVRALGPLLNTLTADGFKYSFEWFTETVKNRQG